MKGNASKATAAMEAADGRAAAFKREIEELVAERGKSEAERIRCIYKTFGLLHRLQRCQKNPKTDDEWLFRTPFVAVP